MNLAAKCAIVDQQCFIKQKNVDYYYNLRYDVYLQNFVFLFFIQLYTQVLFELDSYNKGGVNSAPADGWLGD